MEYADENSRTLHLILEAIAKILDDAGGIGCRYQNRSSCLLNERQTDYGLQVVAMLRFEESGNDFQQMYSEGGRIIRRYK